MAEEQHTGDESDNAMPTPKDAMGPHGLGSDDPERDWKAEYEKAMAERDGIVHEVAEAKGVDRELLSRMSGDDRESVEANADWLKAKLASIPKYPTVDDNGGKTPPVTIERIEAIKDPAQRIKARAQHINLYKH